MKNSLLFFLFFFQLAFAQDRTFYLDGNMMPATKESHAFYRVIKDYEKEQSQYIVQLYYGNGKLKQEGSSTNRDIDKFEGQVLSYYNNTQIARLEMYRDGKRNGPYKSWYPNGNKQLEGFYSTDEPNGQLHITKFWDSKKVMTASEGNGICEFADDNLLEKGPVKNGLRDGNWNGTHAGPDYTFSETYSAGQFNGGVTTMPDGAKILYDKIEASPEPEAGLDAFYASINKQFAVKGKNETDGKIILAFIVTKDGGLEDVSIYKGLNPELDAEAIRVLVKSGKWKPALQRGVPVRYKYLLPIAIQKSR